MSTNSSGSPVLSLLIPIYNVERYLRECLDSAVAQTLKDIEIICINDGSTDNSPAIIREYMQRDARVKMIDKANSGYGDSMNRGLEMARGKYVGILESDDFMAPDALEKLVLAAESSNADFAKANFDLYWSKPEERRELMELFKAKDCGKPVHPSATVDAFSLKPSIWSAVYRRDFLNRNAIRFLPTPGAAFQDASFTFKVFALADIAVYLHDSVLSYRQDNEGSSVNSPNKVHCVNDEYAEIHRWIVEDFAESHSSQDVAKLLRFANIIKYDSYMWSYIRLNPKFYAEFLDRMAQEFRGALEAHEFELTDLKPWKRANLKAIVDDPLKWLAASPDFAGAGAMGRAKHYARVGGPGVVAAFVLDAIKK